MKKVIKFIFIVLLVLIGLFFILPLFIANKYTVDQTIHIDGEKEAIKSFVADFNHFDQWSPWADLDTNMHVEIRGKAGAVGSSYHWEGNEEVGKGSMQLTKKQADTLGINLKFIEPFASESPNYYAFHRTNKGTEVTWHMEGEMSYPWNIMQLFIDMEEAIGKDFQKGLNRLKKTIEQQPVIPKDAVRSSKNIQRTAIPERNFVGVRGEQKWNDIQGFYAEHLPAIYEMVNAEFTLSGAPTGLYFSRNEKNPSVDMAAAIPITEMEVQLEEPYDQWALGGKALKYEHYGSYDSINLAHERLNHYLNKNELSKKAPIIEEYVTDPGQEPDTSKWQTNVYYLLK